VHQRATFVHHPRYRFNILQGTYLIVGHHDRDKTDIITKHTGKLIEINFSILVNVQIFDPYTAMGKTLGGLKHTGVLDFCRNDSTARFASRNTLA